MHLLPNVLRSPNHFCGYENNEKEKLYTYYTRLLYSITIQDYCSIFCI